MDLTTKHYLIGGVIIILIVIVILWYMASRKESYASPIMDGTCSQYMKPGMADYYSSSSYPYPKDSYFKPLASKGKHEDNTVDFEKRNYTPLYTSQI